VTLDQAAFYDPGSVKGLLAQVHRAAERLPGAVTLMEVCGTHTNAIAAAGLRRLLPPQVRLIAGPGCPVCVTPVGYVDRAEALARRPGTEVCTFGDLLRVPSSEGSLERARAEGARVRVTYSPLDALALAKAAPDTEVVFLGVGFETTVPTVAATLAEAETDGVPNFKVLSGHKVMPPPLRALAGDPAVAVDGFICPGHVSVITGWKAFAFLPEEFGLPAAVVGFTPTDVLQGVLDLVTQVAEGRAGVSNLYARVVTPDGNLKAKELVDRFFAPSDPVWRGLGAIPGSGLDLRPEWAHRDAGGILVEVPPECPLFGRACTPDAPVGACMVSSEGACSAWFRHERLGLRDGP
jgi:hydrogenase expression/formation protein HypD